jgi:hypothetical protein
MGISRQQEVQTAGASMCHFSVRQRHPLSLLTTSVFIATPLMAQRHGLNLAFFVGLNAASLQRRPTMGSFATESAYRADKGELSRPF